MTIHKSIINKKIQMSARKITMLVIAFLKDFAESGTCQTKTLQPRTVVTSDGEVDDFDSFIRLLLYTNELNIVGLVYSSFGVSLRWRWQRHQLYTPTCPLQSNTAHVQHCAGWVQNGCRTSAIRN